MFSFLSGPKKEERRGGKREDIWQDCGSADRVYSSSELCLRGLTLFLDIRTTEGGFEFYWLV